MGHPPGVGVAGFLTGTIPAAASAAWTGVTNITSNALVYVGIVGNTAAVVYSIASEEFNTWQIGVISGNLDLVIDLFDFTEGMNTAEENGVPDATNTMKKLGWLFDHLIQ